MHEKTASEDQISPKPTPTSKLVIICYLLHLLVPGFLLVDIAAARLRGQITLRPANAHDLVAAISALWLSVGLGFFFLSRNRQVFVQRVSAPLVSIYTIYVILMLVEVSVRVMGVTPPLPGMQLSITKAVTNMNPAVTPGISGPKLYSINSLGLRGPMPPKHGPAYKIVAVGGSTTICSNLDDSEEWPHRLMVDMNASQNITPVWVGNAGGSGKNTVDHEVLMQWLPGILHVDMVIFLVGANDLAATLAFDGAPTQVFLEREAAFQGDLPPGTHWRSRYPLYRRLRLITLIQETSRVLKQRFGREPSGMLDIVAMRERRAASPILPLPDLSTGLKEYRNRILALAKQCRDSELRCLFLTQPSMWRNGLSPYEQHLLWLGYTGRWENPKGYISAADLERAMDTYNRALLDVCRQNGLECYDIASDVPKNTSVFFDDMHFTEAGARLIAQRLKQYFLSKPPFAKSEVSSAAAVGTK